MRNLLSIAAAGIMLSACTTTSVDNAIQANLPKTCSLIETAHVAFVAVAITGKIPAKTVAKETAAYEGVSTICADPTHVTTAQAVVLAAQAYLIISVSLKDAKAAE